MVDGDQSNGHLAPWDVGYGVFWTLVTLVGWDESLSHVMTYLRAGKSGVEWDEMVQTTWKILEA